MLAGVTQISNTAVATANGGTTATGSDTTPLITTPGLTITKSDGDVTTTPGATVGYTLNYANNGNIGLTGVVTRRDRASQQHIQCGGQHRRLELRQRQPGWYQLYAHNW